MQDSENLTPVPSKRIPWNKRKLTGAKPPAVEPSYPALRKDACRTTMGTSEI